MLSYHAKTGLKEIDKPPFPAARVGTYIGERRFDSITWKLRVKREPKGSTWKFIPKGDLPKVLRMHLLLLNIH